MIKTRLADLSIALEPEFESEDLDFSDYVTPDWIVDNAPR